MILFLYKKWSIMTCLWRYHHLLLYYMKSSFIRDVLSMSKDYRFWIKKYSLMTFQVNRWWFFYMKRSSLINFLYKNFSIDFLYEKIIVDEFVIWKDHRLWLFLHKKSSFCMIVSSLTTFLYQKFIVDNISIHRDHRWRFFYMKI